MLSEMKLGPRSPLQGLADLESVSKRQGLILRNYHLAE